MNNIHSSYKVEIDIIMNMIINHRLNHSKSLCRRRIQISISTNQISSHNKGKIKIVIVIVNMMNNYNRRRIMNNYNNFMIIKEDIV